MNKGLTLKTGQPHMHRFVVTHRVPLEQAPEAYKTFRDKDDGCIKVVLNP